MVRELETLFRGADCECEASLLDNPNRRRRASLIATSSDGRGGRIPLETELSLCGVRVPRVRKGVLSAVPTGVLTPEAGEEAGGLSGVAGGAEELATSIRVM